jgi:hypothetical protein
MNGPIAGRAALMRRSPGGGGNGGPHIGRRVERRGGTASGPLIPERERPRHWSSLAGVR